MSQYTPKPTPPVPDSVRRSLARIEATSYGLKGFRAFCKLLILTNGKPMRLFKAQTEILEAYFAGILELVVIVPKKNGKTTLLAAVALYHLLMTERAEAVIGASSRDQATILFDQARAIIEDSHLDGVFRVQQGYRVIRYGKGRIRVLAADANTQDGVLPTLALVDELHRHPSGDLYGVFSDGLDARQGQMITISTAGAKDDSPLGQIRAKARALPTYSRQGVRSVAFNPKASFGLFEWSLEPDEDTEDIALVAKANPAPWQTQAVLRRRRAKPSMTTGRWLRYACGIWTEGEEPVITPGQWDALRVDIGRIEPGEPVWAAVLTGAYATVALAAPREGGKCAVTVDVFEDFSGAEIERRLRIVAEHYDLKGVEHPRAPFLRPAELLEAEGMPMVEASLTADRYVAISTTLNRLILEGLLMHDGNPDLRGAALAVTTKEAQKGWHYLKRARTTPFIAVAMAAHVATAPRKETEVMVAGL